MSDEIDCISFYDGVGYQVNWVCGTKLHFTAFFYDAFEAPVEHTRFVLAQLSADFSSGLDGKNVNLQQLKFRRGELDVQYFCEPEYLDALLDRSLEMLSARGELVLQSQSYAHRLELARKQWTITLPLLHSKIASRRTRLMSEQMEALRQNFVADPALAGRLKRARYTDPHIVDAFEASADADRKAR